jgi:hypothetical protein
MPAVQGKEFKYGVYSIKIIHVLFQATAPVNDPGRRFAKSRASQECINVVLINCFSGITKLRARKIEICDFM